MSVLMIDLDGTLADFVKGYRIKAREWFKVPIFTTTECEQYDGILDGLDLAQQNQVWDACLADTTFWMKLHPLCTREEYWALAGLHVKHDVYFVTHRKG